MMKQILVPTDFSEIANNAAQYALAIAKLTKSGIVFFHAEHYKGSEELKKLKAMTEKMPVQVPVVKYSFIASDKLFNSLTINELFTSDQLSMVVIGTGGADENIAKTLFGSNTSEIISEVNCPVLAIPQGHQYTGIKKIAYASDLLKLEKELEKVVWFAKLFDAAIEVFHVSPVFPDLGDVEKKDIPKKLESLKEKYSYSDISYYVEKTKMDNKINKGIDSYLEHHNPDVLVLFHETKEGISQFFSSSHSNRLVSHIKTPILIFPKV